MKLNKIKKVGILGFILAASFVFGSTAHADGKAPGEGFYVGAFAGYGVGIVQPKVQVNDMEGSGTSALNPATFEADRGGLGLSGIQGGGYWGWGLKTADDLYVGLDMSFAGSDEQIELKSSVDITDGETSGSITSATAERNWVGAGALRVGYYVNSETLLAFSGGVAISQFDVTIGSDSDTFYAGGPQVGASLTTRLGKVDPNLSLRMDVLYTDYLTADINGMDGANINGAGTAGDKNDSELTGSDLAARIGVTYAFDFPSL